MVVLSVHSRQNGRAKEKELTADLSTHVTLFIISMEQRRKGLEEAYNGTHASTRKCVSSRT